jgi:hypothetical protein
MPWTDKPSPNAPWWKSTTAELVIEQVDTLTNDLDDLRLFARKTADETVTSSTVLQDDDALTVSTDALTAYFFRVVASYTAGGAASVNGIKYGFAGPSGATGLWSGLSKIDTDGTNGAASVWLVSRTLSETIPSGGAGATAMSITAQGFLYTSTSSGAFRMQWAQNTSSGTGTVVKANSGLWLTRLGSL